MIRRAWIDTDVSPAPGGHECNPGGHECNDAFALLHAFGSAEIEVVGLSSVFGNAPLSEVDAILRDMAARFGPAGVPVHSGAAAAGMAVTDAARAIAAEAEAEAADDRRDRALDQRRRFGRRASQARRADR